MTEKELKSIIKGLKKVVTQKNWEKAGVSYIQRELQGRLNRALGFGLLWAIAKNHTASRKLRLKGVDVINLMRKSSVLRSQAYDSRRAAEVLLDMMEDKAIWERFSKDYLSRTSLFRLYFLKNDLETYDKSGKTNTDRKRFLERVKKIHSLTRDEFYSRFKKGSKRYLRGHIKKIKGKEIVIEVTDGFGKNGDPGVGSEVTITLKSKKKDKKS